jgi:hypothetical protein
LRAPSTRRWSTIESVVMVTLSDGAEAVWLIIADVTGYPVVTSSSPSPDKTAACSPTEGALSDLLRIYLLLMMNYCSQNSRNFR